MKLLFFLIFGFLCFSSISLKCQDLKTFTEDSLSVNNDGKQIFGSIITPNDNILSSVALIITGSGPTDRNGKNPMMSNNSLKMLAESLADKGVASVRYDKRGVGANLICPLQGN